MVWVSLIGTAACALSAGLHAYDHNLSAAWGWAAAGVWAFNSFVRSLSERL